MLLVLDIGNTNIKVGLFEKEELLHSWRLAVNKTSTADEYGVKMESFFWHLKLPVDIVDGIIYSSVIPSMNYTIEHMCGIYFPGVQPMQVHSGLTTGLRLEYEQPQQLGSDRICNAVAARRLYDSKRFITVDFGTATTFGVIEDNRFLGGVICPGFKVSTNALIENTAMLPKVEYIMPDRVIGVNTEHCIQSGILYGYVGQLEYLVRKIKEELGGPAIVIATGGMGELVSSETDCIDIINPTLTLQGLAMIYELNYGGSL
ncbi:type III pantothenate kinase [Eubacteriales bacterium OttesenSCG-928-K08]|nr:type III pantothenate kinase [Eubacteriales bacterium OttesenSCG-928-K08]